MLTAALFVAAAFLVSAAVFAEPVPPGTLDVDIGIVHPPDETDTSLPGDDPEDPWTSPCWDIDISCLVGSTHGEAAIHWVAYNGDEVVEEGDRDPGEPPKDLTCVYTRIEITYIGEPGEPGQFPPPQAGWGVSWLARTKPGS